MSHVATIDLEIRQDTDGLKALAAAAKRLGGQLRQNQLTYSWYGRWMNDYSDSDAAYKNGIRPEDYGKCLHAIYFDGCKYEVGLVARQDGKGLMPIWDFFDSSLLKVMGRNGEKLKQAYATEMAILKAKKKGFRVTEQKQANGSTRLLLTRRR